MAQREIKFRAWLEYYHEKGFMDYFELNPQGELFITVFGEEKMYPVGSDHVTLEQYTGFTTYSNKDVYDGDFVRITSGVPGDEPKVEVGLVSFDNGSWIVENNQNAEYLWNETHNVEVIGNIHENPELLEAE